MELIPNNKELTKVSGFECLPIKYRGESRFIKVTGLTKIILKGKFNPIKAAKNPVIEVSEALLYVIKVFGYKLDLEVTKILASEIINDFGYLGAQEIYQAFKLAFNNSLNLDSKRIEPYGEPLNYRIVTNVLAAYKVYRRKVIQSAIMPKELDGSRERFLKGQRVGASKEISESINKMYLETIKVKL